VRCHIQFPVDSQTKAIVVAMPETQEDLVVLARLRKLIDEGSEVAAAIENPPYHAIKEGVSA